MSGSLRKPSLPPMSRAEAERMRENVRREAAEAAELKRLKAEAAAREAESRPDGYGLNTQALAGRDALTSSADVELREVRDGGRTQVFARRRPDTVWRRLGTLKSMQEVPALSASQVDAGEKLTELYAAMMGLGGAPERDLSMPRPPSPSGRTELPVRMLNAHERWTRIMQGFGLGSRYPALFEGLCQDIMETEATRTRVEGRVLFRQPGAVVKSRWRDVVAATTGVANRNSQGDVVKLACEQLVHILENERRR